jgi:hypothetical protein
VHATLVRADERTADDVVGPVLEPDVIEGELERLARALDEGRDPSRDVERRLAAVGEGVNLDQGCCFGCIDAWWTRFRVCRLGRRGSFNPLYRGRKGVRDDTQREGWMSDMRA